METFHDPNLSNYDSEGMRCNRINTLTEGGNTISYDEMNEDLNALNKSCKDIQNFETVSNLISSHYGISF